MADMDMQDTHSLIVFPDGIDEAAKIQILQIALTQAKKSIAVLTHANAECGQARIEFMRRIDALEGFRSDITPLVEKLKFALIALAASSVVVVPLGLLWLQKIMHL